MKLIERKKKLELAAERGRKIAVYLVENTKSAQFRYRCENIMETVAGSGNWEVVWFLSSEISELRDYLEWIDLLVILRQTDRSGAIKRLISSAHEVGIEVLFDLDDLIFDYRDLLLLMYSTNSKNLLYWFGYFWGIRQIASRVDGFLCTNDFLGKKLRKSFKKPYKVIPNSLNRKQVEISNKCLKTKKEHSDFVIGYFSGSPTHTRDLKLIESELMDFLINHDNAKLVVVGYMKFSNAMKKMIIDGRVIVRKPVGYLKLQEKMAEVDVNVAPLLTNDFTDCKSELKFFEAAVVETVTIASPSYMFRKVIKNGENGFIARTGGWYKKISYLYAHREEGREIAKRAREYSLRRYYGLELLRKIEEAYDCFS